MDRRFLIVFAAAALGGALDGFCADGPDFVPPFAASQIGKQEPRLEVSTFIDPDNGNKPSEAASLVVGNKRIAVREPKCNERNSRLDFSPTIYIDKNRVLQLHFVKSLHDEAKDKWTTVTQDLKPGAVSLVCDKAAKSISVSVRFVEPGGREGVFGYVLKAAGESKVELLWETRFTGEAAASSGSSKNEGCLLYGDLPGDKARGCMASNVLINGQPYKYLDAESLKAENGKPAIGWSGALSSMTFFPGKQLQEFSLNVDPALATSVRESFKYNSFSWGFMSSCLAASGRLTIDFNEVAFSVSDTPPPNMGFDTWKMDAIHMPLSPVRNLFPNPSFEQGLRYWGWIGGGGRYNPEQGPRYEIDGKQALFGKSSLVVHPVQHGTCAMKSFSLPGEKGKTYTISYYAKSEKGNGDVRLILDSEKSGGQFNRGNWGQAVSEKLSGDWKRFSRTFTSDGTPVSLMISVNNAGDVWIDGIQYEEGDKATEFVCAPAEGRLLTSAPDNNVEFGSKIDAKFALSCDGVANGSLTLTLLDFYKNPVWTRTFAVKPGEVLPLDFDSLNLRGPYLLKAKYEIAGFPVYCDYYRFACIKSLSGVHPTKDLYGALFETRVDRVDALLSLMRRCGFGASATYGSGHADSVNYEMRKKYGVTDYLHTIADGSIFKDSAAASKRFSDPDYLFLMSIDSRIWRTPELAKTIEIKERYSAEDLKHVEELAFRAASNVPEARVWAMATEEELMYPAICKRHDYAEFFPLQEAVYKGVKRANPNALVLPSGGTSGFSKVHGLPELVGYMEAAKGKLKWDAIAAHPYGSCDGTSNLDDLDANTKILVDAMAKCGYGKDTPILYTEGGPVAQPTLWGDGPDYTYEGRCSYDQGLHEFFHAALMARAYINCLKDWPQVEHFNTWQGTSRVVVDSNLTPVPMLMGINTLGHLLAKPEFVADIRPAKSMRGYAFRDEQGRGVAAVWCTIDKVEDGYERGPVIRVKFDGALPEMFDLMGVKRPLSKDKDGFCEIQLTPAPLFFRSADPKALASALQGAEVSGGDVSQNISLLFTPAPDGSIVANFENLTAKKYSGGVFVDKKEFPFALAPAGKTKVEVEKPVKPEAGKLYSWSKDYNLEIGGKKFESNPWNMTYFYVPRVNGAPDWASLPGIAVDNGVPAENADVSKIGKPAAQLKFKAAWSKEAFYLRVDVKDPNFNPDNPKFWASPAHQKDHLWLEDGCLEVYFDCGADGRLGKRGLDLNDYRYDFCAGDAKGQSGLGLVNRFHEVFKEFGGGVEMPTREAAAKGVVCKFIRLSQDSYAYELTFDRIYLAPLRLEPGTLAGFGLYLQTHNDKGWQGLSLASEPGQPCNQRPWLFPYMILGE